MTRTGRGPAVVFIIVAVVIAIGVILLARGGDDPPAPMSASSALPSAGASMADPEPQGPSLEERRVEWAGEVCTARTRLRAEIAGLGRDLDFELRPGLLDRLDQQLRRQLLSVGAAANALVPLLASAPVDLQQANGWLVSVTGPQQELQSAVERTTGHLDAMVSADGVVDGVREAGEALSAGADAVAAGEDLLTAVQDVYAEAEQGFAPAFAAAPECRTAS